MKSLAERAAPATTIGPYLAAELGDDSWRDCQVKLVSGGKSNLTFYVSSAAGEGGFRRPPLSTVLPTAHDMRREHTVMTALASTDVPVPRTLVLCTDESVVGAPFYVMQRVQGHIVRDSLPPGYADVPEQRHAIGIGFVDVLASLHQVDPHSVGLGDYGRPDGYMERQGRRSPAQWAGSRAGRAVTWRGRSAAGRRSGRRAARPRSRMVLSSTGSRNGCVTRCRRRPRGR